MNPDEYHLDSPVVRQFIEGRPGAGGDAEMAR